MRRSTGYRLFAILISAVTCISAITVYAADHEHIMVDKGWTYGSSDYCQGDNVHAYSCSVCGYTVTTSAGRKPHDMSNTSPPIGQTYEFGYTGSIQEFVVPYTGTYQIECHGASGGMDNHGGQWGAWTEVHGGFGGYSKGTFFLTKGQKIYVAVGGSGVDANTGSMHFGWEGDPLTNNCSLERFARDHGYYSEDAILAFVTSYALDYARNYVHKGYRSWDRGFDTNNWIIGQETYMSYREFLENGEGGGWNGGGRMWIYKDNHTNPICDDDDNETGWFVSYEGGGGGGATSVQVGLMGDGQLKNYAADREDVLIVAGGGGGAYVSPAYYYDQATTGANGGTGTGYDGRPSAGRGISSEKIDDDDWAPYVEAPIWEGYQFGEANRGGGGGWFGGNWYGGSAFIKYPDYGHINDDWNHHRVYSPEGGLSYVRGDAESSFMSDYKDSNHFGDGKATITLLHQCDEDGTVKAEHYLQNLDGSYGEPADTDIYEHVRLGTSVTPTVKSYTGFNTPEAQTVTAGPGVTLVKYYYTRKSYVLKTYSVWGIESTSGGGTYLYGQSVTVDAVVSAGYTWKGWTGTFDTDIKNYTFNMPDYDVELTASAQDITGPEVLTASHLPYPEWVNTDVVITVYAEDWGVGLADEPYSFDEGLTWTAGNTHTVPVNGDYPIWAKDKNGNIKKIVHTVGNIDKVPPVITGLDGFYGISYIDREWDSPTYVDIWVTDDASGISNAVLTAKNHDSGDTKSWTADDSGKIHVNITEGDIFYGDFTVTVDAGDIATNVSQKHFDTTEFLLESSVTRLLGPPNDTFKTGESGKLNFAAYGYVDDVYVMFPAEFQTGCTYDAHYEYTEKAVVQNGSIQFMIPFGTPERGDYVIVVEAWKGGHKLTQHLHLSVVYGTVLDELRTRLK